jgi:ketosteroid isomerase-like protein
MWRLGSKMTDSKPRDDTGRATNVFGKSLRGRSLKLPVAIESQNDTTVH